jgi:hypothetical protein
MVETEVVSGVGTTIPGGRRTCDQCGRSLRQGRAFAFKSKTAQSPNGSALGGLAVPQTIKCLRCSLLHVPMLRRSLIAAVVVGTILTMLNQGDALVSSQWGNGLYWKIPLTYCVPFCVATYGALTNNRQ